MNPSPRTGTSQQVSPTAADVVAESRRKNAASAMLLLGLALGADDVRRATLARAVLAECGWPGGEGAPSIDEALAAIKEER